MSVAAWHTQINQAFGRAWHRPARVPILEWLTRYRRIPAAGNAMAGPWSHDRTPYLKDIFAWFEDPRVRSIAVQKAEQVGGSEVLIGCALWAIACQPGPMLYLLPTLDLAKEFVRDRFLPNCRACAPVRELLPRALRNEPTGKSFEPPTEIRFENGMIIRYRGGVSKAGRESWPAMYVLGDELDRMAASIVSESEGRTTTFPLHKMLWVSRPEGEEGINRQLRRGDDRRYMVPCPECGEYHERRFAMVKWPRPDGALGGIGGDDPEMVLREAYLECPACGCRIHAHQNLWQLARGVWVPAGWCVNRDGVITPTPELEQREIQAGPDASSRRSVLLHGLLNPFDPSPYGKLAAEFVENGGRWTEAWKTRRLGEAWETRGRRIEVPALERLCVPISQGGYALGTAPGWVLGITAGIDVQRDRIFCEVIGWGEGGSRVAMIDAFALPRGPAARQVADQDNRVVESAATRGVKGLDRIAPGLRARLLRLYERVNLVTAERLPPLPIAAVGVDSGNDGVSVYAACAVASVNGWAAVGGEPGGSVSCPVTGRTIRLGPPLTATKGRSDSDRPSGAAPFAWSKAMSELGPVELLTINTWAYKAAVRMTLEQLATGEGPRAEGRGLSGGAMEGQAEGAGGLGTDWVFPADPPAEYLPQLTAEEFIDRINPRNGRRERGWRIRTDRQAVGNHFLDCRVIAMAIGHARGAAELKAPVSVTPAGNAWAPPSSPARAPQVAPQAQPAPPPISPISTPHPAQRPPVRRDWL